jgi:hypothetical protein
MGLVSTGGGVTWDEVSGGPFSTGADVFGVPLVAEFVSLGAGGTTRGVSTAKEDVVSGREFDATG